MNDKLNIKKALRVFDKVLTQGKRIEDRYQLNGITAYTDFDGYTATLCNDYVRLDIFFHNKINFSYSNDREREIFLEKINTMDKIKVST